jgi:H+-transporting ATPase
MDAAPDRTEYSDSDLGSGLDSKEAARRLSQVGYNEVEERRSPVGLRFLRRFWGVTPWLLEITAVLTFLIGRPMETYLVIGLLVFNAALGFIERERAYRAVQALQRRLQINARVRRDGTWRTIRARELVPGDVVRLRRGDIVPADVLVAEGAVTVDQSSLTGESMAVQRGVNQKVYAGAVITRGEATGHVAATGIRTYFGRTIALVKLAEPKLHTEEATGRVVRWLLILVGIMAAVAAAGAFLKGLDLLQLVPLMIILIIAAVPIALPTMFVISMALGSMELAKSSVLVTRLSAGEDAATMTVLCLDKTGTITENRLSLKTIIPSPGFTEDEVILLGALASRRADQDPIDLAFLSEAERRRLPLDAFLLEAFTPFDPRLRRTEAIVSDPGHRFIATKGAVDTILDLAGSPEPLSSEARKEVSRRSMQGERVLAVGKSMSGRTVVVGLVGLFDPPQEGVKERLQGLKEMGVRVKMLTGDALPVAKQVADEVGIGGDIVRMAEVHRAGQESEKMAIVDRTDGLAEIFPEDKFIVVRRLQNAGQVVGMTGDGINDAPALKQAEVGIAVAGATDVAERGLKGVLTLVRTGRTVFQRIVTWILNKIIKTVEIIVFVVFSFLVSGGYATSIAGVILFLFLTDFVTLTISTDRVQGSPQPDNWRLRGIPETGIVLGAATVLESILLLAIGISWLGLTGPGQQGTFVFVILVVSALLNLLIVREREHFWHSVPSRPLLASVIMDLVLVGAISSFGLVDLTLLPVRIFLLVLGYFALMAVLINDSIKVAMFRHYRISANARK